MDIYTCKDPTVEESVERGYRKDAEQVQRSGYVYRKIYVKDR